MLALALLLTIAATQARQFNVTKLVVPPLVPSGQTEVVLECTYDADFTILNWFKGPNEFFRYKPGTVPSTRSFPIIGIGTIEMIACGPTSCHLRLGDLTEEASGVYRCDIERDVRPYKFNSRKASMIVHGREHRIPLIEGLGEEFGEGDVMMAYCRGSPDSTLRWYINEREQLDMRGSPTLKTAATRLLFAGTPPTVTVQCAEFRNGKLTGSKGMKARWRQICVKKDVPLEQKSGAYTFQSSIALIYLSCYIVRHLSM